MKNAALPLTLLAAFFVSLLAGCSEVGRVVPNAPVNPPSASAATPTLGRTHTYAPSPNRIIGYILAIDEAEGSAIVDLTADPLPSELRDGVELIVRTRDLQRTARLSATRFLRGHTLGTTIVTGLPAVGEEVILSTSP